MPSVSSSPPEPEAFVFTLYCFPGLCPVFIHIQTMKNLHLFSVFGEADEGTAGHGICPKENSWSMTRAL